uniref:Uncharacterized protein n=1 Tax=viral metagenome TaxID=1070528 RepID=A0A6C0I367_9ZZZZ
MYLLSFTTIRSNEYGKKEHAPLVVVAFLLDIMYSRIFTIVAINLT